MSGMYFNPLKRVFLNLSGGTVTGDTVFTQGLYATYLSGGTIFSGSTDLEDIILSIAIGAATGSTASAPYLPLSGGVGGQYYFTGNTTGETIYVSGDILPQVDNVSNLGNTIKRFRDLNIINGVAVNFTADTRISTIELKLGSTIITENNMILTGNTLVGGSW
jgi:hypothetical protein